MDGVSEFWKQSNAILNEDVILVDHGGSDSAGSSYHVKARNDGKHDVTVDGVLFEGMTREQSEKLLKLAGWR